MRNWEGVAASVGVQGIEPPPRQAPRISIEAGRRDQPGSDRETETLRHVEKPSHVRACQRSVACLVGPPGAVHGSFPPFDTHTANNVAANPTGRGRHGGEMLDRTLCRQSALRVDPPCTPCTRSRSARVRSRPSRAASRRARAVHGGSARCAWRRVSQKAGSASVPQPAFLAAVSSIQRPARRKADAALWSGRSIHFACGGGRVPVLVGGSTFPGAGGTAR